MSSEIERLAEDLEKDKQLYRELMEFGGTFEELAGWLNDKGYQLDVGELAEILSTHGDGLGDEELDKVAGGTMGGISEEMSLKLQIQMERRSKIIQTLSNITKKISDTRETTARNIK